MCHQSHACKSGYVNSEKDIPSPFSSLFLTLQPVSASNSYLCTPSAWTHSRIPPKHSTYSHAVAHHLQEVEHIHLFQPLRIVEKFVLSTLSRWRKALLSKTHRLVPNIFHLRIHLLEILRVCCIGVTLTRRETPRGITNSCCRPSYQGYYTVAMVKEPEEDHQGK